MNLLTFLLILKASVMTRVRGAGRIGGSDFLMVPVGGKNVSFAGESHSDGIVAFLKALASEIRRDPRRGHSLQKEVYEPISDLFDSGSYAVRNSPWARAAKGFRPKFLDRAGRSLEVLLEEPPLDGGGDPGASAVGGLLVAAYGGEEGLEEAYSLRAARVMGHETLDKIRRRLWAIQKGEGYPDDLRHKCFAPLDIIEEILGEDGGRSRTFEQTTRRPDRYFALPLSLFVFGERMEEWMKIANSTESRSPSERDRGGLSFRLLLENTLKARFPVEGALPVGYEYERFPFLVFNSYNLPELRGKLFAEKQILASNELNVLMLILARG